MLSAPAAGEMKAFPPAGKGMARHVLQLPKEEDESAFKVELIAGKTVRVDGGNRVDRCYHSDHR
jgi:ecotin